MTHEEFKRLSQELIDTCVEFGFMEREIHPYSFKMTVAELVSKWKDYDLCTASSKSIMRSEYVGLADIVQHWKEYEQEPMIEVLMLEGKYKGETKSYHKSTADLFVECGSAQYV